MFPVQHSIFSSIADAKKLDKLRGENFQLRNQVNKLDKELEHDKNFDLEKQQMDGDK